MPNRVRSLGDYYELKFTGSIRNKLDPTRLFAQINEELAGYEAELEVLFSVDGELDVESVAEVQRKISEQMDLIASAKLDASFSALQIRFGAEQMDYNSFLALEEELGRQAQVMKGNVTDALNTSLEGLHLQLAFGEINQETFANEASKIEEAYKTAMEGIDERISSFLAQNIEQAFGLEAGSLISGMQESLKAGISPGDWGATEVAQFLGTTSLEANGILAMAQIASNLATAFQSSIGTLNIPITASFSGYSSISHIVPRPSTTTPTTTTANQNKTTAGRIGASNASDLAAFDAARNSFERRATGGYFNSSRVVEMGEDGPEFIVPVGSRYKQRGIALWEKAGRMLGMTGNKELIPSNSAGAVSAVGGDGSLYAPVTVGDITFDVKIDSDSATDTARIIDILKSNIGHITDDIAHNIALSLQKVFSNMPRTAEG